MIIENRAGKYGEQFFEALCFVECHFAECVYVVLRMGSSHGESCVLQVESEQPMIVGGVEKPNRGRKYTLSKHMTDDEVRQTAFVALLAFYEHELRESFTYKGVAILGPHLSHDKLVTMHESADAISERAHA